MKNSQELYPEISSYLYDSYIVTGLQNRYRNLENMSFQMLGTELEIISTMDEYFYRLMKENYPKFAKGNLTTYLNEIERELNINPLLLLELPLYQLDINTLRKYIPSIDNIMMKINKKNIEANKIFKKFKTNPNSITGGELITLVNFLSSTIPYADSNMRLAQEYLAKYLLNHPFNNSNYNYYITVFLIKFFGYKKAREENLTDTKILIGKLKVGTLGLSKGNYITISKDILQNVLIGNNKLNNQFGETTRGQEILGILQIVYHELRHQKQSANALAGEVNDISFFMAARKVLFQMDISDFDYKTNYKCYETEKDANMRAWEEVEKLIKTYMPSHNTETIMRKVLKYRLQEELEQLTGVRKTKNNHKYISTRILILYLDEAFRKHPSLITGTYKQFKTFYNDDGTPKRLIELLKQPLVYNYNEFYFSQISYRCKNLWYRLSEDDIIRLTLNEARTVINNLKILMNITQSKINKIYDRIQKYQEQSEEVVENIINYHSFATYLSSATSKILNMHPQLYNNLSVKNAISSINENIDMINKNRLVIKIIKTSEISKVGRRNHG